MSSYLVQRFQETTNLSDSTRLNIKRYEKGREKMERDIGDRKEQKLELVPNPFVMSAYHIVKQCLSDTYQNILILFLCQINTVIIANTTVYQIYIGLILCYTRNVCSHFCGVLLRILSQQRLK